MINYDDWPAPLAEILKKYSYAESVSERHNQVLFIYGAILRFLCAILMSYYLRYSEEADARIDSCMENVCSIGY